MNIFTCSIAIATSSTGADNTWFTIKYIVVATVFLCLLWVFSKYLTKKNSLSPRVRHIKVVERVAISSDKSLLLVEFENIFYLLGTDKNGMYVIDKRDDITKEDLIGSEIPTSSFFEQFKKSINKRENQPEGQSDE